MSDEEIISYIILKYGSMTAAYVEMMYYVRNGMNVHGMTDEEQRAIINYATIDRP